MTIATAWIGVDWGTTNMRLWAFDAAGTVLAERQTGTGMAALHPASYEPALLDAAADLLPARRRTPVLVCGMAGARQGWREAPYAPVPGPPCGLPPVSVPAADPRLDVRILPGLCQAPPAADVMRGEETQIAGLLARTPGFDGVACLPGTHTKWARLRAGRVEGFRTILTGELFGLLASQSVLRHSIGPGWDGAAHAAALATALAAPERVPGALFALRAESLLAGLDPAAARARLSGLLIGADLAAAADIWRGQPVAVIGAEPLAGLYAAALAQQDTAVRREDVGALTRAGLTAAYETLSGAEA
ncbi:MAG: 2-dehydro-3-deoxygalactonokinase [Rhodobacteraceae bacterium]|nr:2-dehydro-3-deoxygalactonokinase [Paracoccaceae bacterium]